MEGPIVYVNLYEIWGATSDTPIESVTVVMKKKSGRESVGTKLERITSRLAIVCRFSHDCEDRHGMLMSLGSGRCYRANRHGRRRVLRLCWNDFRIHEAISCSQLEDASVEVGSIASGRWPSTYRPPVCLRRYLCPEFNTYGDGIFNKFVSPSVRLMRSRRRVGQ